LLEVRNTVMSNVNYSKEVTLKRPTFILGFSGWPNASEVSTEALRHLQVILGAEEIGEINPDEFYLFTALAPLATRPVTIVRDGLVESFQFPANRLYAWKSDSGEHDLLLLRGVEPDLRWVSFAQTLLEVIRKFDVRRVISVGGYYDSVPHTKASRVTAVASEPGLCERLLKCGAQFVQYQGPSSFHSHMLMTCRQHGIEGMSVWGCAPSYIKAHYPRATYSVLVVLSSLLEIPINLGPLRRMADQFDDELSRRIERDKDLAEFVRRLEEAYDKAEEESRPTQVDDIINEIQDFLKRERGGGDDGGDDQSS